ncbi:Endonuclease/exonuclease/phosphatase [Podospora aff. communis PSN243]|uniref:Endonuclease/exonuclease/phosphatase n=1 Tax=Podospora aff. communis PSN243 TaxID=3040156 RepID=A0AAV9GZ67_9PEZI|nr:Endonuclease/exonuclease/phosphatase [Podospora aff. communis PSN243]
MSRSISPPPLKRRKVAVQESAKLNPIRIFSWNISGIDAFLPPPNTQNITAFFQPKSSTSSGQSTSSSSPLRAFLTRHNNPHVLFLQELKIAPRNATDTLASLRRALNPPTSDAHRPTYEIHISLPRDKYNARAFGGKLYGVATILRSDFADKHITRVYAPDWDLEGRVLITETNFPETKSPIEIKPPIQTNFPPEDTLIPKSHPEPLALINIYAINGTSAPYYNPDTGKVTGTRHDLKVRYHSLLRDECLLLEKRGFHVVVAGDVNVARSAWDGFPRLRTVPEIHCVNRRDFNGKFFGRGDNIRAGVECGEGVGHGSEGVEGGCLDAVDVWRAVFGEERRYTYFPRGREWGSSCDRVDMVFVSGGLWEAGRVLGTGILDTVQEGGTSDHVPIWVEVGVGG